MDETLADVRRDYRGGGHVQQCPYCGAALNPFYYFCLRCATPYKPEQSVLPTVRPLPLTDGARIRRAVPQVWTLFFTYLLLVLGLGALGALTRSAGGEAAWLVVADIAIAVTTCVFAGLYWPSLRPQFGKPGFTHLAAWVGLASLAVLLPANYLYHGLIQQMAGHHLLERETALRDTLGMPGLVLVIAVLPAILEEVAFRGLLQHWLALTLRPSRAIALAAVLFAALHCSLLSAPYLFAVGWVLGWVKHRTGSLYPSMVIHFLHNLVVIFWLGQ